MNRCLYCYKEIEKGASQEYHEKCSEQFYGVKRAPLLPYKMENMSTLAKQVIERSVTVPGVQPKLSMGLIQETLNDGRSGRITILDALEGYYILKPQNAQFVAMPENEHLSMRLAELFGINVVPSTLIRLESGELCYLTRRVDRTAAGEKIHMIDFLQILELEDKYMGTMEQLGKKVGELSEYVLLDKLRLFELSVFNFIIANNDMHLKNFSMIHTADGWVLSPAYDLLNVKILLPEDEDEFALNMGGKKRNYTKKYFEQFAASLKLNKKQVASVFKRLDDWLPKATQLIESSFLSADLQDSYLQILLARMDRLK